MKRFAITLKSGSNGKLSKPISKPITKISGVEITNSPITWETIEEHKQRESSRTKIKHWCMRHHISTEGEADP